MLFDSEITEFMHEENVVCVAADAVYYLTLAAGLPGKKFTQSNKIHPTLQNRKFPTAFCNLIRWQ